jgi:GGDEF domain-containing protein
LRHGGPVILSELARRSVRAAFSARCEDEDLQDLMRRADAALYEAKQGGRNKVALALERG